MCKNLFKIDSDNSYQKLIKNKARIKEKMNEFW